jgi:hypothetical protein
LALKLEGEDDLLGYLRVQTLNARRGVSFQEILRSIRRDLEESGLDLDSLKPVEEEGDWGEKLWSGEVYTSDETKNLCLVGIKPFVEGLGSGNEEVRRWSEGETLGVVCVLLCPARERAPLQWMRGKRAFEIVVATTQPADSQMSDAGR